MTFKERLYAQEEYLKIIVPFFLFLIVCYFPIFYNLGKPTLLLWDESIYATSAIEMEKSGDYLVQYRLHGSTIKSPLTPWLQILSMKVFGYNEFAVRLPSAIFALFTPLLIVVFFASEFKKSILGYLSGLVLITSEGYIHWHVARTGDPDSILTFFLTTSMLFFYKFVNDDSGKILSLGITTLSLVAAVLSKSVAGLFFLPAMFIYVIQQKKFNERTILRYSLLGAITLVLLVGAYLVLVQIYYPGVLKSELKDLILRYSSILPGHPHHEFFYYISRFETWKFTPWIYFIPISWIVIFFGSSDEIKKFGVLIIISVISYLLIISLAQTKLAWYSAPLYPLVSILVGFALYSLFKGICGLVRTNNNYLKFAMILIFIFTFYCGPYSKIIMKVKSMDNVDPGGRFGSFMKNLRISKPDLKEYSITEPFESNYHILFYMRVFNSRHGYKINIKHEADELDEGEITMVCDSETIQKITKVWNVEEIEGYNGCELFRILDNNK